MEAAHSTLAGRTKEARDPETGAERPDSEPVENSRATRRAAAQMVSESV